MNTETNTTESNGVKPCRKCGATERYSRSQCKPCASVRARKWHQANREKTAARVRKYRESNREEAAEYAREYREANREKIAEQKRAHYEANREKAAEYAREYREANPEKRKVLNHNRRAKIKGNGGTLSKGIVQTLMALQKGKCACCGKSLKHGHHLDHVIPIALGGTNTDDNVQLLTPACNLSKGAKHPVDYMRSKGKLI